MDAFCGLAIGIVMIGMMIIITVQDEFDKRRK